MSKLALERIKQLVNQIETQLDQDIQILDLANQFEMSPWYFQRLFKGLIGDSLGSYVRGRRLSKAAELLMTTKKNVLEIALDVGFNSHEAFSRSFKSYFDTTPQDVRNSSSGTNLKLSLKLKEKPILTEDLIHFLSTRINKEPEILVMPEKKIVGYTIQIASPFVDLVHCNTIAEPWMKILSALPALGINMQNVELHGLTLSPSGNFTEDLLNYIAGVSVAMDYKTPNGMVETFLPEQKVAVFELATHVVNDNLKQKVDSIYGYWFTSSDYERGHGNDYELFKNMVDPMKGQFDSYYVVPLK